MAYQKHVDLVLNEWSLDRERRLAMIVGVMRDDSGNYDHVAEGALQNITSHLHNSYLFATAPHDPADCPFKDSDVLPIGVDPEILRMRAGGQDEGRLDAPPDPTEGFGTDTETRKARG